MRLSFAQPDPAVPQPVNAKPDDGRRAQGKPDANLRAFAQRGDHRVELAQQRMRLAPLRADIDLSYACGHRPFVHRGAPDQSPEVPTGTPPRWRNRRPVRHPTA